MRNISIILLLFISSFSFGQNLAELYEQADKFREKYSDKFYYHITDIKQIGETYSFWYLTHTPKGNEFLIIDTKAKKQHPAFDAEKLAKALTNLTEKDTDPYKLPFRNIEFSNKMDSLYFRIDDFNYKCNLRNYTLTKEKIQQNPTERYWGSVFKENLKNRVKSPDGTKEAYISEGNLWITDLKSNTHTKLSYDGSPYEYYSSNIYWSPNSRKIVCCKYRPVETRKLLLIESSPKDQLQPKTEEYDYPKPGDALAIRKPVLFDIEKGSQQEINVPDVDKQFDLSNIKWDKNSLFFTFDFNKRGHQHYTIYAVDATSGTLRTIVNEESPTFIYYGMLYQHWMENSNELLWISERDGWRHIYLYDVNNGEVKKQLTSGDWVVKTVVHVDEKNRKLIFKACGMDKGEDPYLEKYYSLNMESGSITVLTPENANHRVTFTHDYAYMIDYYSRVDITPSVVVRSAITGEIIYQPEQQPDLTEAIAAGYRFPEVFSAKGRDGETDIWGMIIRPTHFDPNKKYPVVEYIYAGPHDSHVPKSFAISHWCTELAELGFITVIIDGMGTANRSKAFHDVCWKNLKDAGFPDRIAWMKAATRNYPEMDIERVGLYGGSAGGQNTVTGLLFHPDFYKVGVAACGCHDNRMDKIWWNEQWMGYPIGKEYEECSNVVNAHLLQGKLMLILGELDNNVDPASTLQVVDKLIEHNKEFEFVMLPGARHTLGGNYGERKRRDFFVKHLLGQETPEWNK